VDDIYLEPSSYYIYTKRDIILYMYINIIIRGEAKSQCGFCGVRSHTNSRLRVGSRRRIIYIYTRGATLSSEIWPANEKTD